MSKRLASRLLALLAVGATPAAGQTFERLSTGGWSVGLNNDQKGCGFARDFDGPGETFLAFYQDFDGSGSMILTNSNWSIRAGEPFTLHVQFAGGAFRA